MEDELEVKMDQAYKEYVDTANAVKAATIWSFQEWIERSTVAGKIIQEYWPPGQYK